VVVLPEAASILFNGGFPRKNSSISQKAIQRSIFHIQRELERVAIEEKSAAVILCDRGTLDGLAYWPNSEESYLKDLNISKKEELLRYSAVIHLETPTVELGYNNQNPARIESAIEASKINQKILKVWETHPRYTVVESTEKFLEKASKVLQLVSEEVPLCCKTKTQI
jgi:hypothetical protein